MEKINIMSINYNFEIVLKLFFISLAYSFLIAYIFYPGFMTYDTIHALQGARDGVVDSMWPPMVSYIWRILDSIAPFPTVMHFSQILLIYINISFISYYYSKNIFSVLFISALITVIPSMLGSLASIWKDVLLAGFLMSSMSLLIILKNIINLRTSFWFFLVFLLFIFLSICSRHNGVVATIPIVIFYVYLIFEIKGYHRTKKIFYSIMVGLLLLIGLYELKTQLVDKYSIPEMKKLESSTNTFLRSVRILDITGASICAKENYFGTMGPYYTIEDLRSRYHPQHINLSSELINNISQDQRIDSIWYSLPLKNFQCAFAHKMNLTSYLFGFNKGELFLVVEPVIVSNKYGFSLSFSYLRDMVVEYIYKVSKIFIVRPWFLQLVSLAFIIYLLFTQKSDYFIFIMYTSALFYSLSLIIFGNATDSRLMFFTNTINTIVIFIAINFIIQKFINKGKK